MDLQTKERGGGSDGEGEQSMEPIIIGDPSGNYAMIMRDDGTERHADRTRLLCRLAR